MSDTTATIGSKGCNATGITEDLAARLYNRLGSKFMAVVEIEVAARQENADGKEKVVLRLTTVEPAPDINTENHLRNLQRSFYYERKLVEDGPQLPEQGDSPEPTVKDVLAAGDQYLPHAFTPDDFDDQICNLCGARAIATVHHNNEPIDDEIEPEERDNQDDVDQDEVLDDEGAAILEFSGKNP